MWRCQFEVNDVLAVLEFESHSGYSEKRLGGTKCNLLPLASSHVLGRIPTPYPLPLCAAPCSSTSPLAVVHLQHVLLEVVLLLELTEQPRHIFGRLNTKKGIHMDYHREMTSTVAIQQGEVHENEIQGLSSSSPCFPIFRVRLMCHTWPSSTSPSVACPPSLE